MSYILLPYFKNNPKTDSYFTINTQASSTYTLVISHNDIFNNSTKFLTELYNTTIYVYNNLNLGTFKILNLVNNNNKSYTINIKLDYIPSFLDNSLCVLSTVIAPSSINRKFTRLPSIIDRKKGFFSLSDSNTIIINKESLSTDDTLFIYILATNNNFSILNANTSISYLIKNIEIDLSNTNNNYFEFDANLPIFSLIENEEYIFVLSEYNNIKNDNKFFYNPVHTPSKSIIPVIPSEPPSISVELINSVILTYNIDNNFVNNGNFSFESPNPNIVDLYSNIPIIENFNTPNITPSNSDSILNKYTTFFSSIFNDISNNTKKLSTKYIINNTITPDVLPHIPIIKGNKYTFTLNTVDIFNKGINFIKQNSLLYLTNGKNTSLIATNTIPTYSESVGNDVIKCNILYNNPLSTLSNKSNYVLSSLPIPPYINLIYKNNYNIGNTIENGCFTKLIDTKFPQIILSNIDSIFNRSILSFNNILYTIKGNTNVYLNILNVDYSLLCSLQINNIIPETHQTIIEYLIINGNDNFLNKLSSNTQYIFTLYSPSDFLGEDGIINTTYNMKNYLTDLNNLIQGAKISINNSHLLYLNNHNLLVANSIMEDVSNQSTILLNLPLTPYINEVIDALLTNTYNALKKAMEFDPKNPSFIIINNKLNTMLPNPIIYIILNNAVTNIMNTNKNLTDIKDIQNIHNCDLKLTQIINNFNLTKILNKNDVTILINMLSNIILDNNTTINNIIYLIKAQKILELLLPITISVHTPTTEHMINVNKKRVLENFSNNLSSLHGYSKFIFSLIIFSILITILITMSRK
jgi:hypothetical protein